MKEGIKDFACILQNAFTTLYIPTSDAGFLCPLVRWQSAQETRHDFQRDHVSIGGFVWLWTWLALRVRSFDTEIPVSRATRLHGQNLLIKTGNPSFVFRQDFGLKVPSCVFIESEAKRYVGRDAESQARMKPQYFRFERL